MKVYQNVELKVLLLNGVAKRSYKLSTDIIDKVDLQNLKNNSIKTIRGKNKRVAK